MFRKKQTFGLRLWHWANAFLITLLLFTVFLRKTFLSVKANTILIMEKAQALGAVLTEQQANDIARMLRKGMWQWHPIIGLGVVALLVYRFYLFYAERKKGKESLEGKPLSYKLIKKNYVLFYVLLTVMSVTGVLLHWDEFFGLSKSVEGFMKDVHETAMWYFVAFFFFHIIGVVMADRGEDRGLISNMVNGGDRD